MDYYIEIRLLPNPQVPDTILMSILFAKLHHALAQAGHGEVGISFPQAKRTLGDRVRLHGSQQALIRIVKLDWLKDLREYISESAIKEVPSDCMHRVVKRLQAKGSPDRLYRRSVKKNKISLEEAEKRVLNYKKIDLDAPFVQLKSHSSRQPFRLFIQQGEILQEPQQGAFSSYGLSSGATIPWF